MFHRAHKILAAALLIAVPGVGHAALSAYHQDFESLVLTNPAALSGDGWVVYGNVYTPAMGYIYGYGTFPAPNTGAAFCAIAAGEGGVPQGAQQLSVYSDYNNLDHANGNWIESNVFREQTITAAAVGQVWTFQFDAKMGNLTATSGALAFIKTLNPAAGYATTNFLQADMTAIPVSWGTYSISLLIDAGLVGQLLQFGFSNRATYYLPSGIYYDNVDWRLTGGLDVGDQTDPGALQLRPAVPNPFQHSTRFDFSLPHEGFADIAVYDVAGRCVATLFQGVAEAGPHTAFWNGRSADGTPAPAGVYRGVLRTASGRVTRSIVLAR